MSLDVKDPDQSSQAVKDLAKQVYKLSAQLDSSILQTMESHKKRQVYPGLMTCCKNRTEWTEFIPVERNF